MMMTRRTLAMVMALSLAAVMSSTYAKPSASYYRTHQLNSLDGRTPVELVDPGGIALSVADRDRGHRLLVDFLHLLPDLGLALVGPPRGPF